MAVSLHQNKIPESNWSCSICFNLMDGRQETNGSVCISKRCMHIFHRVCVENAIKEQRNCPLCRHNIGVVFLVDNPDYEKQCKAWDANRDQYTLEKAFFKKYSATPEEKGLREEDILRPESLHGKEWNPKISPEEKFRYHDECIENNYSLREIIDSKHQSLDGVEEILKEVREDVAEIRGFYTERRENYSEIRAQYADMHKRYDRIDADLAEMRKRYDEAEENNARFPERMAAITRARENDVRRRRAREADDRYFLGMCLGAAAIGTVFFLYKNWDTQPFKDVGNKFTGYLYGKISSVTTKHR